MEYLLRIICCIHFDDVNTCDDDYVVYNTFDSNNKNVVVVDNYYG